MTYEGANEMSPILGSGEHRYRVVENFAKLPDGWSLTDVASVAVDSKDRIYVFNRGAHAREDFSARDDKNGMKHTLAWIDDGGKTAIDYRPVHDYTMTNDVQYIPPKARVY